MALASCALIRITFVVVLLTAELMSIVDSLVSSKGRSDRWRPDILPSQWRTIVSSSVQAGLDDQEKPMMPRPLESMSPKMEG